MNTIIARFLPVVVLSAVGLAATVGCQHEAKGVATVIELTPAGTLDRDIPIVAKNQRDLAFYSARTQGEAQTRVFARSRTGETRLVYVDAEPGELVRVSDDGTHGVFRRYIAPGNTVEFTVDFQKSES